MFGCAKDEVDENWVEGGVKAKHRWDCREQGVGHACRDSKKINVGIKKYFCLYANVSLGQKHMADIAHVVVLSHPLPDFQAHPVVAA